MKVYGKETGLWEMAKASYLLLKYITRHKWYVGRRLAREGMWWRALIHDNSKLRPSEFFPCACYYYLNHRRFRTVYNRAKLLHMHRNPHHVTYWSYRNGAVFNVPMPERDLIEMVCDWVGTGDAKKRRNGRDVSAVTMKKFEQVKEQWDVHKLTERGAEEWVKKLLALPPHI